MRNGGDFEFVDLLFEFEHEVESVDVGRTGVVFDESADSGFASERFGYDDGAELVSSGV